MFIECVNNCLGDIYCKYCTSSTVPGELIVFADINFDNLSSTELNLKSFTVLKLFGQIHWGLNRSIIHGCTSWAAAPRCLSFFRTSHLHVYV